MMTLEEKTAVAQIKRASSDFIEGVKAQIKLEAMKAANIEKPGTYREKDFNNLLQNLENI